MKELLIVIAVCAVVIAGIVYSFEARVSELRTACTDRGGVIFQTGKGFYCIKRDAVINMRAAT